MSRSLKSFISDKKKIALVVEGGANRATPNVYALQELAQHGVDAKISFATGSSAGATQAAYFVSKQAELGPQIDTVLRENNFFSLKRVHNMMDIQLLRSILDGSFDPLLQLKPDLKKCTIAVPLIESSTLAENTLKFSAGDSKQRLIDALIAGMSLPLMSKSKNMVDESVHYDGTLVNPLPLNVVPKEYDGVIVLRPKSNRVSTLDVRIHRFALRTVFKQSKAQTNEIIRSTTERYNEALKQLDEPRFFVIEPEVELLKAQTTDPDLLNKANQHIVDVVRSML